MWVRKTIPNTVPVAKSIKLQKQIANQVLLTREGGKNLTQKNPENLLLKLSDTVRNF